MAAPEDPAREAMIKAAMMEELGKSRVESLPMDDSRRDQTRGQKTSHVTSRGLPPVQQPRKSTVAGKLWQSAISSGLFDDEDAEAVKGLDDLGGGRLHATRALQVQQQASNLMEGIEKYGSTALHYQRKGMELPPTATLHPRNRPTSRQANLPRDNNPIRVFGHGRAAGHSPLGPAVRQHNTLGNANKNATAQTTGKHVGLQTGPNDKAPVLGVVIGTPKNVVVQARVKYDSGNQPPQLATLYITSASLPQRGYCILAIMDRKMFEWPLSAWTNHVARNNELEVTFQKPHGKPVSYVLSFKEKRIQLEVLLAVARLREAGSKGQKVAVSSSTDAAKEASVTAIQGPTNAPRVQSGAFPKPAQNEPAKPLTTTQQIKEPTSVQLHEHVLPQEGLLELPSSPAAIEPPPPVPELIDLVSDPLDHHATQQNDSSRLNQQQSAIELLADLDPFQFNAPNNEADDENHGNHGDRGGDGGHGDDVNRGEDEDQVDDDANGDAGTGEEEDAAHGMLKHLFELFDSMIDLFRITGKAGKTNEELTETAENIKIAMAKTHRLLASKGGFFPDVSQLERERVFAEFLAKPFEISPASEPNDTELGTNDEQFDGPGDVEVVSEKLTVETTPTAPGELQSPYVGRIEYTDDQLLALKSCAAPPPSQLATLSFLPQTANGQVRQGATRTSPAKRRQGLAGSRWASQNKSPSGECETGPNKEQDHPAPREGAQTHAPSIPREAIPSIPRKTRQNNPPSIPRETRQNDPHSILRETGQKTGISNTNGAALNKGLSSSRWAAEKPIIQKEAAFTGPDFEKYPRSNRAQADPQPGVQKKTAFAGTGVGKYPDNSALADLATLSFGDPVAEVTRDMAGLGLDTTAYGEYSAWK